MWASWFDALGDGTRVLILNLLAESRRPLSVRELVEAIDVGQSTVSHHLRRLQQVGFVLCEREGTTTRCAINRQCLEMFPTAAEVVLGRAPIEDGSTDCAPWLEADRRQADEVLARSGA